MVDQSKSNYGGSGDSTMGHKSPDELITQGKQIFGALGNLDADARERVFREWRNDPATAKVFDQLMAPTG